MVGGEIVYLLGEIERNEWEEVIGRKITAEIPGCVVSPAGETVVNGDSYAHGDITKYQVLAPAGTRVFDGDTVRIRGEDFEVQGIQSFDYSIGRRPALRSHRPRVSFIVARGEVGHGPS